MSRTSALLASLLILLVGCTANNDAIEAQAAFEQIQTAVENNDVEGVWERIDVRSQDFLTRQLEKSSGKKTVDVKHVKAAALEQLRAKMAQANVQHVRMGAGGRATLIIEKLGKGKSGPKDPVDMMKEDRAWKIVLRSD